MSVAIEILFSPPSLPSSSPARLSFRNGTECSAPAAYPLTHIELERNYKVVNFNSHTPALLFTSLCVCVHFACHAASVSVESYQIFFCAAVKCFPQTFPFPANPPPSFELLQMFKCSNVHCAPLSLYVLKMSFIRLILSLCIKRIEIIA